MIDVVNLQRKVKIELSAYRAFIKELVKAIPETTERTFSVAFIGDSRMRKLNELFRGNPSTTDVLSFPHEPDEFLSLPSAVAGGAVKDKDNAMVSIRLGTDFLGDIVISAEQAERQANENDLPLENEIKQLILHGLLHLCGYDHESDLGEMNERELELRDKLGI